MKTKKPEETLAIKNVEVRIKLSIGRTYFNDGFNEEVSVTAMKPFYNFIYNEKGILKKYRSAVDKLLEEFKKEAIRNINKKIKCHAKEN